jgi:type I restriction enzyme M protein
MQPLLDEAARLKDRAVDLKDELKRLKAAKAAARAIGELSDRIAALEKSARDLQAQAAAIDAAVYDLKAVNPTAVATTDERTPAQIVANIERQGELVARALGRLKALLAADAAEAAPTPPSAC